MPDNDVIGFSYDEEPAPAPEAAKELSIETEVQEAIEAKPEPKSSPQEERARADGWVPLEDWKEQGKDPNMWSNPEQFNLKGELMGRIQQQSGQLTSAQRKVDDLEQAVRQMAQMSKAQVDAERAKVLKELRDAKAEAISEGNGERVTEIEELMDDVQIEAVQQAAPQPQQQNTIDPQSQKAFESFVKENKWYVEDPYLKGVLNYVADEVYKADPTLTVEQVLVKAKKRVVENNPSNPAFAAPKKAPKDYNGTGDGDRASTSSGTISWGELDDTQKMVGQTYIDEGLYKNKQEYLDDLANLGLLD